MNHDMDASLRKISDLISKLELLHQDDGNKEQLNELLSQIQTETQKLKDLSNINNEIEDDPYIKGNAFTMKKLSYRMWNVSIEMDQNAFSSELVRLKDLSCRLLLESIFLNGSQINLESVLSFYKFVANTGKKFLNIDDANSAIRCWKSANDLWFKVFDKENNISFQSKLYHEMLCTLFCINRWYSECTLNDYKEAKNGLKNAQYFFLLASSQLSDDDSKLMSIEIVTLFYNLGVNRYKENDYQEAIILLEEAVTIIDERNISFDKEHHSKILRLISNAYMYLYEKENESMSHASRQNYLEKSFRFAELANRTLETIHGKYLLLKLYLNAKRFEDIEKEFKNLMNDSTIHYEMHSSIIALMIEHKQYELVIRGYNIMLKKYISSPHIDKIYCMFIDFLINAKLDLEEAKVQIDKIIMENQSITKPKTLTIATSRQLHFHIWQVAIKFYHSNIYLKAMEWFKRGLDVLSILNDDSCNKSQTLRMIALCALKLDDINSALTYANLAKSEEPESIATYVLLFEIYLATDNDEELNNLVESVFPLKNIEKSDEKINPLTIFSQKALEKGKINLAEKILERLISSENIEPQKFRVIFRNAIKLVLSQESSTEILSYAKKLNNWINIGKMYIKKIGIESYSNNRSKIRDELKWLYGLTWNTATKLKGTHYYDLMLSLFHSSYQFCKFLHALEPHCSENVLSLRDALLVSSSSLLLLEKSKSNMSVNVLDKIMKRLNQCKLLNAQIQDLKSKNILNIDVLDPNENIELLIIQTKILRGDQDILSYIHSIQDKLSSNSFEVIASLALENSSITLQRNISTDALKLCLELHKNELYSSKKPIEDLVVVLTKLLATYRRLIVLSVSKQDSIFIFDEVIDIIKKYESLIRFRSDKVSINLDKEIQWLVIEAYNNGVYYWKLSSYDISEKWITRSLSINQYFNAKAELEPKIISAYSDVLAKKKDMMIVETIEV